MKNYIAILILFNIFCFGQEESTGNILEDHDRAVEGILSEEIKKQTEIVNKALAKQSNEVLFSQYPPVIARPAITLTRSFKE